MADQRVHPRIPVAMEVTVRHPILGTRTARTTDVSDGGLFVNFPDCRFSMGDDVSVQLSNMEDAPILHGVVVRITEDGFGLAIKEQLEMA